MNLKQKIYNKHILLYNHDKDVFNYDYLALQLPEIMFSVEDVLELGEKYSDCYNEICGCYRLPKLQSLRRRNLNILAAVRENMRAMEFVDGPVIQRLWIAQHCQSMERACLCINKKINDKLVWRIKTLRERRENFVLEKVLSEMMTDKVEDFLEDKWLAERGVGYRMVVTEWL